MTFWSTFDVLKKCGIEIAIRTLLNRYASETPGKGLFLQVEIILILKGHSLVPSPLESLHPSNSAWIETFTFSYYRTEIGPMNLRKLHVLYCGLSMITLPPLALRMRVQYLLTALELHSFSPFSITSFHCPASALTTALLILQMTSLLIAVPIKMSMTYILFWLVLCLWS